MPKIEFIREERDCGHNKDLRADGVTRGILYDWKVMIDGEYRALLHRVSHSNYYEVIAAGRRSFDPIKEGAGWSARTARVGKKADFEAKISELLERGKIPTLQQMADQRAAYVRDRLARRAERREDRRIRQIESAGVALYEALKAIIEDVKPSTGIAPHELIVDPANLARAQHAVAMAEGAVA